MYFTLGDILVTGLLGGAGLYFLSAIRVRELAVQAVTRAGKVTGAETPSAAFTESM